MRQIDVFNGDADGLCALHQLRLANPVDSELVTGIKRDIKLLDRVEGFAEDAITVLDISLESNRQGLMRLLNAGATVEYFDHHHAGEIPRHSNFRSHIDLSADVCTSILVDRHLTGLHRLWAIAAAFGDNINKTARALAASEGLSEVQIGQLANLGEYLNYNSYGDSLEDLYFRPDDLYREMKPYADPIAFVEESPAFARLESGFRDDFSLVNELRPISEKTSCAAYLLPDQPWARRVSGIFANRLANEFPARAHAVLTINQHNDCTVSVRAPLTNPRGADELCLSFETGGGRKAAAGINRLPIDGVEGFLERFGEWYC